jgi:hypothetical protein
MLYRHSFFNVVLIYAVRKVQEKQMGLTLNTRRTHQLLSMLMM